MSARILVVEDDRTMAEVLLAYLQRGRVRDELDLPRRRRGQADHAAVIILSARGEEEYQLAEESE